MSAPPLPGPPPPVDLLFGPPVVGSWLNVMMFTVELAQASSVFMSQDRWQLKMFVGLVVLVDIVGTLASCAHVYLLCVSFWGNAAAEAARIYWPYPLVNATAAVTAAMVHAYLIRRYWTLSRNLYATIAITLVALLAFCGACALLAALIMYPHVSAQAHWNIPSRIWQIASAVTDISLAVALVWRLRTVRSSFRSTQSLVRRLMLIAVETGATTSTLFLITVLLLLNMNAQTFAVAIELCVGRAYAITVLYNINIRRHIARDSSKNDAYRVDDDAAHRLTLSGIQVVRSVHVTADSQNNAVTQHSGMEAPKAAEESSLYLPATERTFSNKRSS